MTEQAPIRLYDSATSPNCHRVKVVLEEKEIPYRMIPVDLKAGEQKKPDFSSAESVRKGAGHHRRASRDLRVVYYQRVS